MRDAAPVQFALKFSFELAAIIRPYARDRQLLQGNIICNQRQESGRCVLFFLTNLTTLKRLQSSTKMTTQLFPPRLECFIDSPTSTKNRCPFTLARSSVSVGTACPFALAWKHVSHAPHWPVVSIPIISAVFLVVSTLGCASMRWTSITSRNTPALIVSVVPGAILTNPFSVKFAPRATSCLGIRLAPVDENSSIELRFHNRFIYVGVDISIYALLTGGRS